MQPTKHTEKRVGENCKVDKYWQRKSGKTEIRV